MSGSGLRSHNVDDLAAAVRAELNVAGSSGEQGVVVATADVVAGVEVGAALADDDLTGADELAAEALDAQTLSVGVTAVAEEPRPFLCAMSGFFLSS